MKKNLFSLMGLLCLSLTALCFTPPYLLQPENNTSSFSQNQTFKWVTNNDVESHKLSIYECDYEESSLSESINLNDYEYLDSKSLGNIKKISGLTYAEGFPAPLIICGDGYQQIDGYSPTLIRKIFNRLFGFYPIVENYKSITHLYNDHYVMIDEATGKLMYLDFIPRNYANLTFPLIPSYDLNFNNNGSNEGIEGITYNQYTNSMYIAKKKSPMQLYEFKAATSPNFSSSPNNLTQPFNLEEAAKRWGVKNVSGLFHLSKSKDLNGTKASNNLLVLSSESHVIIECDLKGKEISRLNLNVGGANGTLTKAIDNAQGIAFGYGRVYLVSSAVPEQGIDGYIYSFINNKYKKANATVGNQVYTKSNIKGNSYSVSNLNVKSGKTYCWNIEGTNIDGQKYSSNYFSFGEETVEETQPEIEEKISIRRPFVNTTYRPGDIVDIEWTQNIDFNVNVYFYNFDNGTLPTRTAGTNINGRKVQFKIPTNSFTGNNYSIRVASANDETNYVAVKINVNAEYIPIGEIEEEQGPTGNPTIAISSPLAGQTYLPKSILPIKWFYNSNENLVILLKNDSNNRFLELESNFNNNGALEIKVPKLPESSEYYIQITSSKDDQITAKSEKFTIAPLSGISNIKLSNGFLGDKTKYLPGDDINLTWNDNISGDVIIQLFNSAGEWVSGFTGVTKSDGYEQITLKEYLPINNNISYNIRVISVDDSRIYAFSEPFRITSHKAYNFTVPESTTYNSKNMMVVKWDQLLTNVNGLERVGIILKQNGEAVKQITASTRNDGVYYWFPNVNDGDNYQFQLASTTNKGLVADSPFFSLINGQAKLMQKPDFVVAPNPASDFVNISFENTFDGKVNLELYNANGIFLKEFKVDDDNMRIDVSDLPSGYYFLNMRDKEQIVNKKLLIK